MSGAWSTVKSSPPSLRLSWLRCRLSPEKVPILEWMMQFDQSLRLSAFPTRWLWSIRLGVDFAWRRCKRECHPNRKRFLLQKYLTMMNFFLGFFWKQSVSLKSLEVSASYILLGAGLKGLIMVGNEGCFVCGRWTLRKLLGGEVHLSGEFEFVAAGLGDAFPKEGGSLRWR